MNRSGGNAETRYNWQINAHNHAADWYFESIADGSAHARRSPRTRLSWPTARAAARSR